MKTNESFFIGCSSIEFVESGGKKWVQVLKVGEYQHPIFGKFSITPSVLKKFKSNFDKGVRGIDLAFNYEHGLSKAHGTKAAGWFKELELRADDSELWVFADWTPEGEKHVAEKEYRYTSAEFLKSYKDAETGRVFDWVLKGAALTNVPFVKGMDAIAASELNQDEKGYEPMKLSEAIVMLSEEHGIDLRQLQHDAKRAVEAESEVTRLSEANTDLTGKVKALETEKTDLAAKVEAAEKAQAESKFSELQTKGMKEGKLTKVFAEGKFREMYDKMGAEFCEGYLADLPKVVDTGDMTGDGGKGKPDSKGKPADVQLNEMAVKLAKEKSLPIDEAVEVVLSENPELEKAYREMGR